MKRLNALFLSFCLILAACGSVPPTPTDRFYRLQATSVPAPIKAVHGPVSVHFRADSLYAERPIIYIEDAAQRQLRQYHYHLWLYPPAQMVESNLMDSLTQAFDFSRSKDSDNVLEGRVLGFERVLSGKSSKAVVALEMRLVASGRVLTNKVYKAEQTAADDSMGAFVEAMEKALVKIYSELLTDLGCGC